MISPLNLISIAALIAMSPMVIQAQSITPNEKVVASGEFRGAFLADWDSDDTEYRTCGIYFLSTDDNDTDVEVIRLEFAVPRSEYRTINGKRQKCQYTHVKYLDVNELEKCVETRTYRTGRVDISNVYYVKGRGEWYVNEYKCEDGTVTKDGAFRKPMFFKTKISEDLYNYLSETLKQAINYSNTTRTIDGDAEMEDGSIYDLYQILTR